jgi:predicted nicotinamide N-methyase
LHGTGSSLWDSSIVLLKYLERTYNTGDGYWRGKRVLELGAGVGLCGIVLAHYGAHVTMTDIGECLQLLRRNIDSNRDAISGGSADCVELLWSSTVDPPASLLDGEFDFILATDCLLPYNPELLFALSHTMARLMKSKKTVALVTFEERFNVAPFFESCRIARLVESAVPFDEFDAAFRDEAIRMVQLQQR